MECLVGSSIEKLRRLDFCIVIVGSNLRKSHPVIFLLEAIKGQTILGLAFGTSDSRSGEDPNIL